MGQCRDSPRHGRCTLLYLGILVAGSAACFDPAETACTLEARYGLQVEIRDSVSSELVATGAHVTASSGSYHEVLQINGGIAFGATERAGTYRVTVTRPGYRTWVRSGVTVTRDACHVTSVWFTALLQPLSP